MSYLHASAPRPVGASNGSTQVLEGGRTGVKVIESTGSKNANKPKKKYRDPLLEQSEAETIYVAPNIMFDPRVHRGPTAGKTAVISSEMAATLQRNALAANHLPSSAAAPFGSSSPALAGPVAAPHDATSASPSRPSKQQLLRAGLIRPAQPSVAYIHNHITVVKKRVEVPLHLYLLEQKEPTLVHDNAEQTDPLMEEAPTPDYVPRKTGVDIHTQVDNEMVFDFDIDVSALLEIVVSKTLEQSLMEVREEEEMFALDAHRNELIEKYNAEEQAAEELLKQEKALYALKEKTLQAARLKNQHILAIKAKLAAGFFSRHYLRNMSTQCLADLKREGFFFAKDNPAYQIETEFIPQVQNDAHLSLAKTAGSRTLVEDMVTGALEADEKKTQEFWREHARVEAERAAAEAARIAAEEELARRQKKIQLFIHTNALPPESNPVGPIYLTGESTIADVENKVYKWMEEHPAENADGSEVEIPKREYIKFLWDGQELSREANTAVYDIGIQNLATLTMELHLPPPPPVEKEEGEDEEDEDGEEEEEEEEEEEGDV